jgi:hypothetical protein
MQQNVIRKLVSLGRYMIQNAAKFADDVQSNDWARVGQLLTGLGTPFAPSLAEFSTQDRAVVSQAVAVVTGKIPMPAVMDMHAAAEPRRTRKARMTRVMTKPVKPVKASKTKASDQNVTKRRGRPAGSKMKVVTPVISVKRRGRPPGSKNKVK